MPDPQSDQQAPDQQAPDQQAPDQQAPDRSARTAALWATVVAVPVAALVAALLFSWVHGQSDAPTPGASIPPAAAPSRGTASDTKDPVQMAVAPMGARAQATCRALVTRLPASVADLPRRAVTDGAEQNAAFGNPPLTLACGVPQPRMCATVDTTGCVPLDTELLIMNKVCWYATTEGSTHTFTTMDRDVAVRVTVPVSFEQPAGWANEFSDLLYAGDPAKRDDVPSACP